ncbi:flagellar hook-basal body complex protein [Pseudomonas stutzeri]|uniref:Flagellar hook protein FlgE n=1 Tax=Stutzerimonas stutzeri KOS6 TaxID=1218352 RepID=A0A061JMP1_STUST|nr:flagellar hook protein FlgE [Stutzerimonas stutzeri]EWC41012.1 flagellar hook protein FlgE [Stutzerimonas stutzeri KOS6]MBK3866917.1 flagellar hook-basal body complex protein [Stutzerimonas stutzeri]
MSFNIGLSGLRAASKDLNVTGNNIANAGTVGFKQSRAEFSDLYAASVLGTGKNPQGGGVLMSNISQQFNQGNINYTQNALDLAINGNGFFQVSNNGAVSYTRAGYFGTDSQGFLVDNFGYKLQGFPVDGNGNVQSGMVGGLRVEVTKQAPRATSEITTAFNLNSTQKSPATWQASYDGVIDKVYRDNFTTESALVSLLPVGATDAARGQAYIDALAASPSLTPYDQAIIDHMGDITSSTVEEVGQKLAGAIAAAEFAAVEVAKAASETETVKLLALSTANATFNPADPTTYNSSTSLNIYDSQGNAHVMTQYFVKTGANTWDMKVLIDGRNPADPAQEPAEPYVMGLTFDSSGALTDIDNGDSALFSVSSDLRVTLNSATGAQPSDGWIPAISDGGTPATWSANGALANPDGIVLDFSKSSQYASAFAVNSVAQDGYTTGELAGLEIDETGVIFARYTNGQSKVQGQIVLANFASVQGLTPVGKSQWVQSVESGEPVVGTPGAGALGALVAGALEDSNVELSDQLVNLIVAQRNYQANAKTIETESAVTQTIINLR